MAKMKYAEYQDTPAYLAAHPGAGLRFALYRADQTEPLIGRTTGMSDNEPIELIPIEEAGNDGVDEIATGRHGPGTGSISLFWTPERNDKLPTRGSFLAEGHGIEYTLLVMTGKNRVGTDNATGEGVVLDAYTGLKISSMSSQTGARGLRTQTLQVMYENRMNGAEWAAYAGA